MIKEFFTNIIGKNDKQEILEEPAAIISKWQSFLKEMNRQINTKNPSSFSELKIKKLDLTEEEDMARVNPYRYDNYYFTINCAYCTSAYDLRRRGFDVEADDYHNSEDLDVEINSFSNMYAWYTHNSKDLLLDSPVYKNEKQSNIQKYYDKKYPGIKYYDLSVYTSSDIIKAIRKQGNYSRGHFILEWANGKSHSVIYESKDGCVVLRDCQANKTLSVSDYTNLAKEVYLFRVDNEEPTERILNCIKNKMTDSINMLSGQSSPLNLAFQFKNAGYTVYTVTVESKKYYKVYLKGNNKYLFINADSGSIKYKI